MGQLIDEASGLGGSSSSDIPTRNDQASSPRSSGMQHVKKQTRDIETAETMKGKPWADSKGGGKDCCSSSAFRAFAYGCMNVVSASGIVFANKYVFTKCHFPFTYALTWIHTVFTLVGMMLCARAGMFEVKHLPFGKLVPIAAAYVAYIVLGNLSLNVNTVGFYQVMKIAVAPTVIFLELLMFHTLPNRRIMAAVAVVCLGIGVATVTDSQLIRNLWGIAVGVGATFTTALYQIWAGSKQKELKASSMQLLHAYTPHATVMLGLLVPMLEPMGWSHLASSGTLATSLGEEEGLGALPAKDDGTLLGYHYTRTRLLAIVVSSALGLLVSLSTFLFIGATSSLTYNVVGHMKTVIILTGGCLFFGDSMPLKKFIGVCIAMSGIIWYTHLKLVASSQPAPSLLPKVQDPRPHGANGPGSPVELSSGFSKSSSAAGLVSRPVLASSGKGRLATNAQALLNAS